MVHVGTHKTGTKSIQLYFSRHWDALRVAGLYQPNAGRHKFDESNATPGHHDLAFDLMHAKRDSLDALVAELRENGSPDVFISSEEFHPLAAGNRLTILRDTLATAGYETTVIVYLREQASYAQSMFAEMSKARNAQRFAAYVNKIGRSGSLANGPEYHIFFEYSKLVLGLAHVFGEENVVVRPYDGNREPAALIRDILRVVTTIQPALRLPQLGEPSLLVNRRSGFIDVLRDVHAAAVRAVPDAPDVDTLLGRFGVDAQDERLTQPFSALSREEALLFVHRFAADNARVQAMCSIQIPGVREEDIARDGDPRWTEAAWQRSLLDLTTDVWFR
jgi:hypothetical protein